MQQKNALALLKKYREGTATEEEKALLDSWYLTWKKDEAIGLSEEDYQFAEAAMYSGLPKPETAKIKSLWPRVVAAASILIVISVGFWFYTSRQPIVNRNSQIVNQNDIAPGKNTATLTLANGKTINLSDAKTGVVIANDNITYNDGSSLRGGTHEISSGLAKQSPDDIASISRNDGNIQTIKTPRGGTYQITLSDGTRVWLNAASSLIYSAALNNKGIRRVKLEGEAYFEVAKDKKHPFVVSSNGQEVEVLGTHFNINGYAEEGTTKTTLLEGSVKVSSLQGVNPGTSDEVAKNVVVLKPSQQSILATTTGIKVKAIDPEEVVAWKNGDFIFKDQELTITMRQIARWYNVEIMYEPDAPMHLKLGGSVSRANPVSVVLSAMEKTGKVKFKIEGRRISISKK
jgi:transmembrane sensor